MPADLQQAAATRHMEIVQRVGLLLAGSDFWIHVGILLERGVPVHNFTLVANGEAEVIPDIRQSLQ